MRESAAGASIVAILGREHCPPRVHTCCLSRGSFAREKETGGPSKRDRETAYFARVWPAESLTLTSVRSLEPLNSPRSRARRILSVSVCMYVWYRDARREKRASADSRPVDFCTWPISDDRLSSLAFAFVERRAFSLGSLFFPCNFFFSPACGERKLRDDDPSRFALFPIDAARY